MGIEVTEEYIKRVKADWDRISKENLVNVTYIKGAFYGYGSELACLRLFRYYNEITRNPKSRIDYSVSLVTWYFRLEVSF